MRRHAQHKSVPWEYSYLQVGRREMEGQTVKVLASGALPFRGTVRTIHSDPPLRYRVARTVRVRVGAYTDKSSVDGRRPLVTL